jgi:hypothetical protein
MDEKLQERREARIAAGRAAYARLNNNEHFRDWVAVADALVAIREEAMGQAHTNRPQGPPYRAAFKAIIARETWVAGIDDTTRTHCYWLVDNLPAVTAWRDTLAFRQRDEWNHPATVKRNYERLNRVRDPKGAATETLSPMAEAKATIVRQAEEIDRLRRVADEGSLFDLKRDSVESIARVILNTIGDDKIGRLVKELSDGRKEKQRRRAAHAG